MYGDTDSNYVIFDDITHGDHKLKCNQIWDRALRISNIVSNLFPNPMKIEFEEKIYWKFLILTKKRYMYYSCNKDGCVSEKIRQKGVLLARRDNCLFVKNINKKVVKEIFNKKLKSQLLEMIYDEIMKLMQFEIDYKNLAITKSINNYNDCIIDYNPETSVFKIGSYKVPSTDVNISKKRLPAQVQLEIKMIDRGLEKAEGARIQYIVLKRPGCNLQGEKIDRTV